MPNKLSTTERKQRQVRQLMKRDGNKCHYCNIRLRITKERFDDTATRDHVIPKSMGGLAMLVNFVLACNVCNNKRGDTLVFCTCDFCSQVRVQFYNGTFVGAIPRSKYESTA